MPSKNESKHDAFRRLADRRVEHALDEIRLVGQLSSRSYENTQEEAEVVITCLDKGVRDVAALFNVPYSTAIGAAAHRAAKTGHLVTSSHDVGPISPMEIAKAIEKLNKGEIDAAREILKGVLV